MGLSDNPLDLIMETLKINLLTLAGTKRLSDLCHQDRSEIGGKALGLLDVHKLLLDINADDFTDISINIPDMVVIGTSVFDAFIQRNQLWDIAMSKSYDHRIADYFQKATMPFEVLKALRNLIDNWRMPLAIRSSSLLEDSIRQPFAGIYQTKMIPNNALNIDVRFHKLIEAIKFVWASTFFSLSKDYSQAIDADIRNEKMAVIIQKMVGKQHQNRFYPELSGVARTYNFYPIKPARPADGVASLALGLGKTIVDGHATWTYSPKHPNMPPPYSGLQDVINKTQKYFWVVNMGQVQAYNPIKETEFMQLENLVIADQDGVLDHLASTYDPDSDRLSAGTGLKGPRVLNFAPILSHNQIPLNTLMIKLLENFAKMQSCPVEIEFAMTFSPHRFSLLQVRPMNIITESQQLSLDELNSSNNLVASESVLGNGTLNNIRDIVYVLPKGFDKRKTKQIAAELAQHNQKLLESKTPYLLIVLGRLGTFDPWLGIPVTWGQVCGAKVIVEVSQDNMRVELSQGSHYFHNIINLDIKYFCLPFSQPYRVNWHFFKDQVIIEQSEYTQHVKTGSPLLVKVDGQSGRGVIQVQDSY